MEVNRCGRDVYKYGMVMDEVKNARGGIEEAGVEDELRVSSHTSRTVRRRRRCFSVAAVVALFVLVGSIAAVVKITSQQNQTEPTAAAAHEGDDYNNDNSTNNPNKGEDMPMIRVGTWNVLLMDDEYHTSWGCPLQIALCSSSNDTQVACTRQRRQRVWDAMEGQSDILDVLFLQEVEDDFLQLQSSSSNWTTVARSGECAILLSTKSRFQVMSVYEVALSDLSGCSSVPMALLAVGASNNNSVVAVGALHVKASVSDMDLWYATACATFQNDSSHRRRIPFIIGGDFNHNLTSTTTTVLPLGWRLVYATNVEPLLGTTQKEQNWMGNFDGFLVSVPEDETRLVPQLVQATVAGFMPKVVRNGQTAVAQFDVANDDELMFSAISQEPFVSVPKSNSRTQVMSDHLLVTGAFVWRNANTPSESPTVQ
jgi:hypothetical protein